MFRVNNTLGHVGNRMWMIQHAVLDSHYYHILYILDSQGMDYDSYCLASVLPELIKSCEGGHVMSLICLYEVYSDIYWNCWSQERGMWGCESLVAKEPLEFVYYNRKARLSCRGHESEVVRVRGGSVVR